MDRNVQSNGKRKRIAYFEVLLVFFILTLFLTNHYLLTINYLSQWTNSETIWMGIKVDSFIREIVLYSAIFFTFILGMLIIHRNFDLKKKKVRR